MQINFDHLLDSNAESLARWTDAVAAGDWDEVEASLEELFAVLDRVAAGAGVPVRFSEPPPAH